MSASDRWELGRKLAAEGRYAEALDEYIWFHEHSRGEPGMGGVRLSYALSEWVKLAEVYPPARKALEATRDRKTDTLLAGAADWGLFHDVVAINESLGCPHKTNALYRRLAETDPAFAARCFDVALPALLAARDFELAEHFLTDADSRVLMWVELLNRQSVRQDAVVENGIPPLAVEIDGYADRVTRYLDVLRGVGRLDDAAKLQTLAINAVTLPAVRTRTAAAFQPGARRWYDDPDQS